MMMVTALFYVLILGLLFDVVRRAQLESDVTGISPSEKSMNRITSSLAALVIVATVFLGSFFVLGYVELASGHRVVRVSYATAVGFVSSILLAAWLRSDIKQTIGVNRHRHYGSESIASRMRKFIGIGLAARAVILFVLVLILLMLIILPSFPRGFEASAKHLPIGLHFFQNNTLLMWDTIQSHNYPANGAIYYGFLLSFLPERLVTLSNTPFVIPVFAAIYGLARFCGADKRASLWSALGLFTVPLIAFNVFELEVDLAGIAFVAMAVYFVLIRPRTRPTWPVLAGLSIGIAYGIKALHLVSAIYLGIVLTTAVCFERGGSTASIMQRVKPIVLFSTAALAIASYWLIRNYLSLQNPLYPVHMPFFDLLGWTGKSAAIIDKEGFQFEWVRSSAEWLVYPWLEWHFLDQNFKATSGLGALFATVVPVSFVAASYYVLMLFANRIRRANRAVQMPTSFKTLGLLLGGVVFVLGVWSIMGPRQPRYGMGALVFLFPLVGWTISQTSSVRRTVLEYLLSISALIMLFVVFFTISIDAASRFLVSRQFSRAEYYEYPELVDELGDNSTILNLGGRSWNYPLFGSRHTNSVVSYRKTMRLLSPPQVTEMQPVTRNSKSDRYVLHTAELKRLGATHLFVVGTLDIRTDGCSTLRELQRLDTNRANNIALPDARILFEIVYCSNTTETP